MIVWTTPGFVFFTCPSEGNWEKGGKVKKPLVLSLSLVLGWCREGRLAGATAHHLKPPGADSPGSRLRCALGPRR